MAPRADPEASLDARQKTTRNARASDHRRCSHPPLGSHVTLYFYLGFIHLHVRSAGCRTNIQKGNFLKKAFLFTAIVTLVGLSLSGCDANAIIGPKVPQDRIDLIKVKVEQAIRVQDPGFREITATEGRESLISVCGMVEQREYGESIWRPFYATLSVDNRFRLTTPTDTRPMDEAQRCFADPSSPGCGFGEYDKAGWDMTLIQCPQFK